MRERHVEATPLSDVAKEVIRQVRNVFAAIAHRRHLDVHDRQAEIEIFAEGALVDLFAQVAIGCREHADIDLVRAIAADALDLALLEHAQELGLQRDVELADLVEEDRAAVGLLEAAGVLRDRAGEAALLVAEQRRFDQLARDGPQSSTTNGFALRADALWSARATISLPVPVSPVIST